MWVKSNWANIKHLITNVWTNYFITLYQFWMLQNVLECTFSWDTRYTNKFKLCPTPSIDKTKYWFGFNICFHRYQLIYIPGDHSPQLHVYRYNTVALIAWDLPWEPTSLWFFTPFLYPHSQTSIIMATTKPVTRVMFWCPPRSTSTAILKCLTYVPNSQVWCEPFLFADYCGPDGTFRLEFMQWLRESWGVDDALETIKKIPGR